MTTTRIRFGDTRLPQSFWQRVKRQRNGCWHWAGRIEPKSGYGDYWSPERATVVLAHRWAYETLVEPLIPRGQLGHLQVDHECHNRSASCKGGPTCLHRRCVNPAHLVAKAPGDNTRSSRHTSASKNKAKTHCKRGHPLEGDNLMVDALGRRNCRTCKIAVGSQTRRRRLAAQRPDDWEKPEYNSLKTHCKWGHSFDEDNTAWYRSPAGNWARACKTCRKETSRRHYERNHGKNAG